MSSTVRLLNSVLLNTIDEELRVTPNGPQFCQDDVILEIIVGPQMINSQLGNF